MANDVDWIKITTDMFDNKKIKKLRRLPEGNNIVLLWVMLLTLAGKSNAGGMILISENVPYTIEDLADELKFEIGTVKLSLEALERMGMIHREEENIIISNWYEYQNKDGLEKIREQTRLRVANHRERQKSLLFSECNVTCNATVTQCNATDIDKDIDKEKDIYIASNLEPSFELVLKDNTLYPIYPTDVTKYKELYPKIDVEQQLRSMVGWCDSNPQKRKTRSGVKRFINSWLSRENDRKTTAPATASKPKFNDFENKQNYDDFLSQLNANL